MHTSTLPPVENDTASAAELKTEILALVRRYHAAAPTELHCDAAGLAALVESLLDADFAGMRQAERFEDSLTRIFGVRKALLVNSGTSANLVAVSSLTSRRMGKLQLKPGDEVITLATGSPALVAAIVQNQLVPVYVDLALPGFNVDVRQLQAALSARTRAIALAHLHGNPFDLDSVTMFAAFNNLLLVEDCRDATGASFGGRPAGCFGQFATASFHSRRQLSTGEGGAVLASTPLYRSIAESIRDGGHNLRATEMQAVLGSSQAEGLALQLAERGSSAKALVDGLAGLSEFLILPESLRGAQPSWLELPIAVRDTAPFKRDRLVSALTASGVPVRPCSPSLPTHPAFQRRPQRTAGSLNTTDFIAHHGLLLAVPHGDAQTDAASIAEAVHSAVRDLR